MVEKLKIKTPVAIIGLGISGESALQLILSSGIPRNQIATFDNRQKADFQDEKILLKNFKPATLVVSPGVPLSLPWIQKFQSSGGILTSELALGFSLLKSEKVIAVTGSVGKSTVVSLLGAALQSFSPHSFFGGNLGIPLSAYAEALLKDRRQADWVVLELSSYQLENCGDFSSEISAITYFTPNHLERYGALDDYYKTKWSLVSKTRQACVLNKNGGDLFRFSNSHKGSLPLIWTDRKDPSIQKYHFHDSALLGEHNQDNLAVAGKIAEIAGWPAAAFEAMRKFPGLPHRMENISRINGVLYVNDSKATTIESVRTAVESLQSSYSGHLHLLLGGRDKNLPWEELSQIRNLSNTKVYYFGECGAMAEAKSGIIGEVFPTLGAAIEKAKSAARSGDLVLLSPGGSSLDEFKNFEERGHFFRQQVQK